MLLPPDQCYARFGEGPSDEGEVRVGDRVGEVEPENFCAEARVQWAG
jgi:hypothetical protein